MNFSRPEASFFIPDGLAAGPALERITHLGIGAHQDDLEFMAFHGIKECFRSRDKWMGGVTCTNGSGSPRTGVYGDKTDAEMIAIRRQEQDLAATLGRYGAMIQLDYPSSSIREDDRDTFRADLRRILEATRPEVVYTHNPADKHETHVVVLVAMIDAIRSLPPEQRPRQVYGCEVWRGLDWMLDKDKVALPLDGHDSLTMALTGVFDSQVAGGKRYDLATIGRRHANATFFEPHAGDDAQQVWFAMDLTPVTRDGGPDLSSHVRCHLDRFNDDVISRLARTGGAAFTI